MLLRFWNFCARISDFLKMNIKALNFFSSWLILLLWLINLEYAIGLKCKFVYYKTYYHCTIIPDSIKIKEKHLDVKTVNDVYGIDFNGTLNGVSHLNQSELTPMCQRFKNLNKIRVEDIKHVDENSFQQCRKLMYIYITNSKFKEIPENIFIENPQLVIIYLGNNKLRALPEDIFINQRELEYLFLEQNEISCLPSNILKSLTKLQWLYLYRNKIQSLNSKWFENLQLLEVLDLSDNEIQDLPKNVFSRLENLVGLELNGNQLTTIHSDSFGIHRKLNYIYLKNNKINAIDKKLIDNTAVKELDMRKNVCSKQIIPFRNRLKEKLSNCFSIYQQRQDQSSTTLSTDCNSSFTNKPKIECGTRHFVKQLIHRGTDVKRGEYPWNVALISAIGSLLCGGTLMSNRHIITAAHCIRGKDDSHFFGPNDFSVLLGVHNYSKPGEIGRISVRVSRINVNPIWNTEIASYDGDIAILELANVVQFNNYIRPICLADEESKVAKTTSGTVVGFGLNENGTLSDIANKLEVPIRNYHRCTSYSRDHHSYISYRTFCGGPADGRGVCSGDSGGGVYVLHSDQFYLRGLVSASLMNNLNQCDIHKEAIFTDVTKYYDWIGRSASSSSVTSSDQQMTMRTFFSTPKTSSRPFLFSRTTVRDNFDRPIWN